MEIKNLIKTIFLVFVAGPVLAQSTYYNVTPGTGYGLRFWSSNNYKIHMGNNSKYHYGPVTSYSIKMNMSSNTGRGWTWGKYNQTPIAALSNVGDMQIADDFTAVGDIRVGSGVLNSNLNHLGLMEGVRSDDNSYEWVGFYSGTTRQGIILYDGAWSGANNSTNEFSITAENGNKLTLNTRGNHIALMPDSPGNVGIGTTNPTDRLHIRTNVSGTIARFDGPSGTDLLITENSAADYSIQVNSSGYVSNLTIDNAGSNDMNILLVPTGGKVAIGTAVPDEALTVKGNIHAEEVRVDLNVPGPDYVFHDDYQLKPLAEIEEYIRDHHHLPEIPSAAEMKVDGIALGEMNMLLLKKIEELTLHMIYINQTQQQILEENEKLKNQIEMVEEKLVRGSKK